VKDEEAILGVALGFEDAAAPNVGGYNPAVQERGADHQEAMALQGIFFGAHEGSDVGPGEGESAIEAFGEIGGAAARSVINVPVFPIDAGIGGPAAQTFTEEFVANSGRRKIAFERLAIELRKTKTGGAAADIAKSSDAVSGQDGQKIGNFEIGMADGEKMIGLGGVGIHESYTGAKRILPERRRDGKHGRPTNRIGILRVMSAGDRKVKYTPC
jgi:hypothetical protein